MTINPEAPDFVEPPIIAQTQDAAERLASQICEVLRAAGWDYALVSLARRVDFGATSAAPSACALLVDTTEAGAVILGGYVHNVTAPQEAS